MYHTSRYAAAWTYIAYTVPKHGVDANKSNALQALAFVQGIMWMHMCADEIVGVFQAAGRVAGVRAITASLAGPLCQLAMGTVGLYMYKLNAVYP